MNTDWEIIRRHNCEYFSHQRQLGNHTYVLQHVMAIILYQKHAELYIYIYIYIYRVSQEEWTKLRESVPYVELSRYNPKHLYPKMSGYGDSGQRSLKL